MHRKWIGKSLLYHMWNYTLLVAPKKKFVWLFPCRWVPAEVSPVRGRKQTCITVIAIDHSHAITQIWTHTVINYTHKSNNAEENAWLILISCTILMLYLSVFPARVLDPPCHSYTQEGGPLVKSPSNEWTLNGCLSWSGVHKILILSVTVSHSDYPLMAPPQWSLWLREAWGSPPKTLGAWGGHID